MIIIVIVRQTVAIIQVIIHTIVIVPSVIMVIGQLAKKGGWREFQESKIKT